MVRFFIFLKYKRMMNLYSLSIRYPLFPTSLASFHSGEILYPVIYDMPCISVLAFLFKCSSLISSYVNPVLINPHLNNEHKLTPRIRLPSPNPTFRYRRRLPASTALSSSPEILVPDPISHQALARRTKSLPPDFRAHLDLLLPRSRLALPEFLCAALDSPEADLLRRSFARPERAHDAAGAQQHRSGPSPNMVLPAVLRLACHTFHSGAALALLPCLPCASLRPRSGGDLHHPHRSTQLFLHSSPRNHHPALGQPAPIHPHSSGAAPYTPQLSSGPTHLSLPPADAHFAAEQIKTSPLHHRHPPIALGCSCRDATRHSPYPRYNSAPFLLRSTASNLSQIPTPNRRPLRRITVLPRLSPHP